MVVRPLHLSGGGGGGEPETVQVDGFQDFHTGADTDLLTDTILADSKRGDLLWQEFGANTTNANLWRVVNGSDVALPRPISVGGVTVASTGTKWLEGDYDTASGYETFRCFLSGVEGDHDTVLAEGFLHCLFENPTFTGNNLDVVQVDGGGGYGVLQVQTLNGQWVSISHTQGGSNGPYTPGFAGDRLLYFQLFYDGPNQEVTVRFFDPNHGFVFLGESVGTIGAGNGPYQVRFNFGYLNLGDMEGQFRFGGLCVTEDVELRDPVTPVTAPAPDNIVLNALGSSSFSYAFDAAPGALDGYKYDVAEDSGFSSLVYSAVEISGTSGTVVGLDPVTTYYFRIRSVNAVGDGANSATEEVTTTAQTEQDWTTSFSGGASSSVASGERGYRIQVGASDVEITQLGCWFVAGTYANVLIRVRDSGLNIVASATVPISGATANAFNYAACSYTLLAGQTYYITRDVSGYNDMVYGQTQNFATSVATKTLNCDETGADTSLSGNGGITFKYLS